MVVTLGKNAHSYRMAKKWAVEFKHDRDSMEDDPCPRRPVIVTTQEAIAKIRDIIMAGRQVTEYYIATEFRIHAFIHNELQCPKWQHIVSQSSLDLI